CTVTKRHYSKGFYVEWQRKHHAKSKVTQSYEDTTSRQLASVSNEMLVESNNFNTKNNISKPLFEESSALTFSPDELKVDNSRGHTPFKQKLVDTKPSLGTFNHVKKEYSPQHVGESETPTETPKVELFTWLALGSFSTYLLLGIIGLFLLYPIVLSYLVIALLIAFMVFSFISAMRVLKNPKKYKAKGLTWTFFGITLAILVLMLIGLVGFILLLTGNYSLF
ncbi:MAG TPA: hypothetical protein PLI97_01390, partial [Fluviicola sp.]|nr:hypothetical protein [Fluviicola sp.]